MTGWLSAGRPRAIAHRGGGLEAEENTWPAFENAIALGYTHLELDVHATKDGHVVIHHDPTLTRLTGDPRAIADLTLAELRQIRTHTGAELPLLADLMDRWPHAQINIDPKSDAVVAPLITLLKILKAAPRIGIGSFDTKRTAQLRTALPGITWSPAHAGVAALWFRGYRLPTRLTGFPVVQVPTAFRGIPIVTPRFLRAAQRHNIAVQVWTVDDARAMHQLLDMGVSGIMTDRPTLLKQVLTDRGEWGRDWDA